ncbi:TonB-dependent receptor domain-containing protein [Colwellia psychrerythraea]|uniref:TonB-dependent receptor n=1 Tax=Colwellia psychrerythraea TaxID=28229 RepID=A0A099KMU4_COLPS|nr:TonB-dependent receptor [Colwellia psychrerythraea]KGJ91796.1 TonB-dependent receptor [Colwellia psychrerythraea]
MKKTLLALSISSLFYSSLSFAEKANAVMIDKAAKADETIVVTANRSIQDKFDTLAAVDVFTRESIEQIQPLSVSDLLGRVAGISITTQGTSAHKSSAFIRGTNSDHILVLVNGVRVGSATLGVKSIADIPVQLVERVEVIRGPRAALWGSDAVGGVIQIFTRDLNAGEGQAGIKVGSNSLYQGYGALGFGNEEHSYTLSATAEKSDGFDVIVPDGSNMFSVDQSDDDGYDRQSVGLSGTSQFTKQYALELNTQYDQGTTEIDANTMYSGDETSYENYHVLLRNHLQLEQLYLQLGLSTSQDSNEDNYSDYNDQNGFNNPNSLFTTTRDQVTALAQIPFADSSEVTAGFEWYSESIDSNNAYDKTKRDANALFVTGRHNIEQIKLEASVRYDKVGDINGETTYQLATGYQVSDQLLFSLSHGTAFKAPSFNDLYYPFSGNLDLISETADSSEFLTRYQNDIFSVEVSVYQTNIDNLIEWAPVDSSDPYSPWQPDNIAQAEILGAEATISADIADTSNRLTFSHVDAEDKTTGKQLARRPNFSANYNFIYNLEQLDFTFDVNYQGSSYDNAGAEEKTLKAYTLLDLGVNYRLNNRVSLFAKVTNVTDKGYQTASEYPGAERGYSLTLDYKF